MSQEYRKLSEKLKEEGAVVDMRKFCMRPGKMDKNGKPIYFTEQQYKDVCDVNKIITKYDKTGLIIHVNKIEAKYGDMTGHDYKQMLEKVIDVKNMFNQLPSEIRNRFSNSPERYLSFLEDPGNREEAIKLGLIKADTPPEIDGLGEHVIDGKIASESEEKD
jgi:phage internal scaffolding protein